MHSLTHPDACRSTGRGASSCSAVLRTNPAPTGGRRDVPGLWTMAGTWDKPHYTNVQMPFAGRPPEIPEINPTGVYEREFEIPATWAGKRVVLHVGAAESVLIVTLNGVEIGVGKDSHLASEFDITAYLRPGRNTLSGCASSSGPTRRTSRTRTSGGTAGSPARCSCTRPRDVYLADVKAIAGLARRPDDRHARPGGRRSGSRGAARSRAGPSRHASRHRGRAQRPMAVPIDRRTLRGWTLDDQRLMRRAAAGAAALARTSRPGRRSFTAGGARAGGLVTGHLDVPDVGPGPPRRRASARLLS